MMNSSFVTFSLDEETKYQILSTDCIGCVEKVEDCGTEILLLQNGKEVHGNEESECSGSVSFVKSQDSGVVLDCNGNGIPKVAVEAPAQLPEAKFVRIEQEEDENCDGQLPIMNSDYIKWSGNDGPQSPAKKGEEVEYEIDEVDIAWLDLVNKDRSLRGEEAIVNDKLEFLIDRLEKESFLQMSSSGMVAKSEVVDDESVCSICHNGESWNTDVIIFCELCNIAVHQECYGVPYIPEGPWICRRCLLSPAREVKCTFCPNKGGAMKQAEDGRWGHVACVLWIPELSFSNTVFQEPIEGIESIQPSRWKLTCFICKIRDGACIQCNKSHCYVAFHVSCAQMAGIYMKMECITTGKSEIVKKVAYCNNHAPPSHANNDVESMRKRLKHCRKMLSEKRKETPTISTPIIAKKALWRITTAAGFVRGDEFIRKVVAFWKLKRIKRNGIPLLRSLQNSKPAVIPSPSPKTFVSPDENINSTQLVRKARKKKVIQQSPVKPKLTPKLKPRRPKQSINQETSASDIPSLIKPDDLAIVQKIRYKLEGTRTLLELIKRREKLKQQLVTVNENAWLKSLPHVALILGVIESIVKCDRREIFTQPVDTEIVSDYLNCVKTPMDLSTMRQKALDMEYDNVAQLKKDFNLMIDNCLQYNKSGTVYYRAALCLRDDGAKIFADAQRNEKLIQPSSQQVPTERPKRVTRKSTSNSVILIK